MLFRVSTSERTPVPSQWWPPPADRVAGSRGVRGWIALAALVGSVITLELQDANATGGGGSGPRDFVWRLDGPGWTRFALLATAVALAAAAVLVWLTRRSPLLGIALLLLPLAAVAGGIAYGARENSGRVSLARVGEARKVLTAREVRDLLGAPAGHGETSVAGQSDSPCEVWVVETRRDSFGEEYLFCFSGDRVIARFPSVVMGPR